MTTRRDIFDLPAELREFLAIEHDSAEAQSLSEVWARCEGAFEVPAADPVRKADVRNHVLGIASRTQSQPRFAPVRLFSIRNFAFAAVLLMLIGFGFLLTQGGQTFRAPLGTVMPSAYALEDGSTVYLAAGSRVSVNSAYGELVRKVSLQGEGFFDVVPGDVPFVVETYNSVTSVVGTRFSVRAWPKEINAQTEVLVEKGVVQVAPRRNLQLAVRLIPGQSTSVADEKIGQPKLDQIDINQAFSWLSGGYEYRNEPIGNVLDDLSRRFGLVIEAPNQLRLRPISIFNQADGAIDEVLGDIAATIGVRFRRIAGGYELYEG